jgi:DNA-binding LacI/PurR family transcriptional regulator
LLHQGKKLDESRIRYGDFTYRSGYEAMEDMLRKSPDFDALFCANDHIAAGAIHAAESAGLRVPQDIAILGFDNREFAAFWPTPISTFSQPLEEMGRQSAKHLFDLIEGKSVPPTTWLHSTLIVRSSTRVL